jgi:CTP:molybdopterin cytidylyltransferase MocA
VTVAAVILAASPASALTDADGLSRVRRLVDVAWSGGALPVVVVAPDPEGTVAAALSGTEVTLATPVAAETGPVGQMVRGVEVALEEVHESSAVLLWPARLCWVGPETVTSLLEAHGATPGSILRPTFRGDPGWPVLVPVVHLPELRTMTPDRMPDDVVTDLVGVVGGVAAIELGDPGTTIDGDTPRAELPAYEGPPEPVSEHRHEWGEEMDQRPDDAPLGGPRLAGPAE